MPGIEQNDVKLFMHVTKAKENHNSFVQIVYLNQVLKLFNHIRLCLGRFWQKIWECSFKKLIADRSALCDPQLVALGCIDLFVLIYSAQFFDINHFAYRIVSAFFDKTKYLLFRSKSITRH